MSVAAISREAAVWSGTVKILVDCEKCQGHALCASQAPEVYELDNTGYNSMGSFTVVKGQEEAAKWGSGGASKRSPARPISVPESVSFRDRLFPVSGPLQTPFLEAFEGHF